MPRAAVCRARPSLPGVPARNHEWEPREAPTLTARGKQAAPALPATAAGCHCRRAAEQLRRRREAGARVPVSRSSRPAAPPTSCLALAAEAPRGLAATLGPPSTPGALRPPRSPPAHSEEQTNPGDGWAHCCGATRASSQGLGDRGAYSATPKRAPWRNRPAFPRARSSATARRPAAQQPRAGRVVGPAGGGGVGGRLRREGSQMASGGSISPYASAAEPERLLDSHSDSCFVRLRPRLTGAKAPPHPPARP